MRNPVAKFAHEFNRTVKFLNKKKTVPKKPIVDLAYQEYLEMKNDINRQQGR